MEAHRQRKQGSGICIYSLGKRHSSIHSLIRETPLVGICQALKIQDKQTRHDFYPHRIVEKLPTRAFREKYMHSSEFAPASLASICLDVVGCGYRGVGWGMYFILRRCGAYWRIKETILISFPIFSPFWWQDLGTWGERDVGQTLDSRKRHHGSFNYSNGLLPTCSFEAFMQIEKRGSICKGESN